MRAAAIPVVALALAGCSGADPCESVAGTCLTLDVKGDVGPIDTIGVTLSGAFTFANSSPLPESATGLPVLVGVELPDVTGQVHVVGVGRNGGADVGHGTVDVEVTSGTHARADLLLGPVGSEQDLAMAADMADAATAMPDLAMPDLAMPDLAMPDLAKPDLAMPDLAMPDLAPPPPMLSAISPALGPTTGGTAITLSGANFANGATVTVNGVAAANVVVTPTKITANTPASPGTQGLVPVVVTNPNQAQAARNDLFAYYTTTLAFAPQTTYATAAGGFRLAVADFNNDKHLDVVTANQLAASVSVLLGDGKGSFAAAKTTGYGNMPTDVVAADLNGDGNADFVVVSQGGNAIGVFEGKGDGTFKAPVEYATPVAPIAVALADMDADQKLDAVVTLDGSAQVGILRGNGLVFAAMVTYPSLVAPWPSAVGDLNGDGNPDVVTPSFNNLKVSVLLNNGMGGLAAHVDYPIVSNGIGAALGDYNRDGLLDVAVANFSNLTTKISVLTNKGMGVLNPKVDYDAGRDPYGIIAVDLNGDGNLDLVVPDSSDNTGSILPGRGDATFAARVTVNAGTRPRAVVAGDFDEDGKPDLVFNNQNSANVSVVLNRSQ